MWQGSRNWRKEYRHAKNHSEIDIRFTTFMTVWLWEILLMVSIHLLPFTWLYLNFCCMFTVQFQAYMDFKINVFLSGLSAAVPRWALPSHHGAGRTRLGWGFFSPCMEKILSEELGSMWVADTTSWLRFHEESGEDSKANPLTLAGLNHSANVQRERPAGRHFSGRLPGLWGSPDTPESLRWVKEFRAEQIFLKCPDQKARTSV